MGSTQSKYKKYNKYKLIVASMLNDEIECLKLLKTDININLRNKHNENCFFYACKNNMNKLLNELIKKKSLHYGIISKLTKKTEILFCSEYNINDNITHKILDNVKIPIYYTYIDHNNNTAIMNFIINNNYNIVKKIMNIQTDFSCVNYKYQNILHLLIKHYMYDLCFNINIDNFINKTDDNNFTPFMYLCSNNKFNNNFKRLFIKLLKHNSSLLIKNNNGLCSLDYIVNNNDLFIYFLQISHVIINKDKIISYCKNKNDTKYNIILKNII